MTNQADARVAEAVGYKLFRYNKKAVRFYPGKPSKGERIICVRYGDEEREDLERVAAREIFDEDDCTGVPPFISAPTAATDQIVKEYVRMNWGLKRQAKYVKAIIKVVNGRREPIDQLSDMWAVYEAAPGDYATALLAIQEERGE